jgi:hypothetical protein
MTRFAIPANSTAVTQPHVPYVLLVQFDFVSGFVRVNSSDRSFIHQGNTYGGLGTLGAIGGVKENETLTPEKLEFQLSGVDNSLLSTTLTEDYHGRDATLWIGYLTNDLQFVGTPEILWEGYMDVMTIRTESNASTISLVCENRLIRWNNAADFLYTYEHQILFDATDKFFDQVALLPNKSVRWGDHVPPGYTPDPRGGPYW